MKVDSEALVKAVIDAAIAQPTKRFQDTSQEGVEASKLGCKYFYTEPTPEKGSGAETVLFDQPCCIIGHALHALGHGPDLIIDKFDNGQRIFSVLGCANEDQTDRNRSTWLGFVQADQDHGKTWAEAVLNAGPIS